MFLVRPVYFLSCKTLILHGGNLGEAEFKESVKKTTEVTKTNGWKQDLCCFKYSGGAKEHDQNVGEDWSL